MSVDGAIHKTASEKQADVEKNSSNEHVDAFEKMVSEEADHDIKFRTLSVRLPLRSTTWLASTDLEWQKTSILLFGEYVALAILALSWSWSVLGWVGGIFITAGTGVISIYTSYVLWQFCMANPHVRNICDVAQVLFPGIPKIAYEATAIMLLLNNLFIMGFHTFTGGEILNTLSDSSQCTAVFQFIAFIMGVVFSIPRTLKHVSLMSILSASSMAIAILLFFIFVGIEDHPTYGYNGNWPSQGPVTTQAGAEQGVDFVSGWNAALNIIFLWIGHILYPSFIAEMEKPQDFPKALAALSIMELTLFCVTAAIGYHYMGQYSTAPAIGSLTEPWARKAAFAFVLPPTIIIGAIYCNVAAQYVFRRTMGESKHLHSHTVVGWASWIGVVIIIWAVAFILGNVIPSMGDFLAITGAAFDSFFGFMFWALAFFYLNNGKLTSSPKMIALSVLNIFIFGIGLFLLGPGLYTSISAIARDYSGSTRRPFSCATTTL